MTNDEIYAKLADVFEGVFDEDVELRPDLTAGDVRGWDSLGHIRLMLATQKAFKVKFTAAEVSNLANVGELVGLINRKLG